MKKTLIILLAIAALLLTTCKKMPELKVCKLELTNENVAYSQTSAEIKVQYEYPTDLQYVNVTMSENSLFNPYLGVIAEVNDTAFIANFVDLHTDKKYYYKFEYSNGINAATSEVHSFYLDAALVTLPTVQTKDVTDITITSAKCGGEITDDGGYYVTSRGVCWSTHINPTIFDSYTTDGMNTGTYTSTITDLVPGTIYYVRAFAINEKGTSYGTEYSFETETEGGGGGGGTITLPTVTTNEITDITSESAICGGNVTSDGNGTITARGVCWSTAPGPTINCAHTTDGTGTGAFTSNISGLNENSTYYIKAYATNEAGTAYGEQKTFTTIQNSPSVPTGAINGLFTINENGAQVWFSQGNLQYQASTNTWRFAENQWDYVGGFYNEQRYGTVYENGIQCDNELISPTYDGWIDHFGWGTSGYNHGAVCYQPWSISETNSDYYAYGSQSYNLSDQTGQADWGYNAISNGGNTENTWRTLSNNEWSYVMFHREIPCGFSFVEAKVNGVNGLILPPDNWDNSIYTFQAPNCACGFESNIISLEQWNSLQDYGLVFFPAAGQREGGTASGCFEWNGEYWTTTTGDYAAQHAWFHPSNIGTDNAQPNYYGKSVRLVRDAN